MIVLGSTGSIGINTLKVAKEYDIKISALCANKNINLLNQQIDEFKPKYVAIGDERLKSKINHNQIFCTQSGILDMIAQSKDKLVVNALVGFAGLKPTIHSIKLGKTVALANKESLVVAGAFIDISHIIPIDSEHFGLSYLINKNPIKKMIITASGGAFRDTPLKEIPNKKLKDALKHPNWSMGQKITIDSATMTNKLFELIEAKWLFKAPDYDAVIEKNSIIHAFIDFLDGSTVAHFAQADMKLPIAYAILKRVEKPILPCIDLTKISSLSFLPINSLRYPIWEIKNDLLKNPKLGVVVNAANEVAIEKFIKDKIDIFGLAKLIQKAFKEFENVNISSLEDIFEIDLQVRKFCKKG